MDLQPPVDYSPALETPEADEEQTTAELIETLRKISTITLEDSGHAMRSVHAKSHGLLHGELRVLDDLPATLQQGIFARPDTYPVFMRLSTPPGDLLADSVSLPRGLGVKILDVDGPRLEGSEGDTTQDFVMVNGPAVSAPSAKAFLKNLKLLAATTDKAEGGKKILSSILRGTEKVVEALGGESATLKTLGGHPATHILGETFFTQAPIRFGDFVAKLRLVPASPELAALKDQPVDVSEDPYALRGAVVEFFAARAAEWDLQVQLCRNLKTMPIEDASVPWPEDKSPYLTVARITAPVQPAWDVDSADREDRLSFSPWHGIEAHRPLGSIMRVRKPAYASSVEFRARHNGCPVMEPRKGA